MNKKFLSLVIVMVFSLNLTFAQNDITTGPEASGKKSSSQEAPRPGGNRIPEGLLLKRQLRLQN
jgi:hypothetical protein